MTIWLVGPGLPPRGIVISMFSSFFSSGNKRASEGSRGSERQVLLYEGLAHPVLCDKIRYHHDRRFRARLLPPAPVPTLPA